jgi:carbon-monoxide dehydrogenase medium subunit
MNLWQRYVCATSVSEALRALASAPGPAFPIAGGTDLLLDLNQGRHSPAHTLVDLNSIDALTAIEARGDHLFIGAAAPLSRIVQNALVLEHAQAIIEACDLIGGPQVRNVATLGGNVAHALPAADGTIALLALNAGAEIASLAGTRRVPMVDMFLGPGKSALRVSEANEASSFKRIMRPQGIALPIINVAIWIKVQRKAIRQVRIAVGPGGPVPWRARAAEQLLVGKSLSEDAVRLALDALLADVGFRSSPRRASSDYRHHLVGTLFRESMTCAWERALQKVDQYGTTQS